MINISERPAEAADRALPGQLGGRPAHRQAQRHGDRHPRGALERPRDARLVSPPDGHKPEQLAPALAGKIRTLPDELPRSLTCDQGPQMRD